MTSSGTRNTPMLVNDLSALLHGSSLQSIEILPGGLKEWESIELPPDAPKPSSDFPFVFVEGNLGIPKRVLYALYLVAISTKWHSASAPEVKAASSIVIILNPAHQTALNARKILIKNGHLDPKIELVLMELISRGSPECAKQSIVWDHRRWCFVQIYGVMGQVIASQPLRYWASSEEAQSFPKITPTAIEHELLLIHHTCETYPRNYHSWAHWHFIIDISYASIHFGVDGNMHREFLGILVAECTRLRRWVEQHVSDYSAMHQLCQSHELLDRLMANGMLVDDPRLAKDLTSSNLIDHALSLVLAYPSHESLWMYLRIALAGANPADCKMVLDQLQSQDLSSPHFKEQLFGWYQRTSRS